MKKGLISIILLAFILTATSYFVYASDYDDPHSPLSATPLPPKMLKISK